jgi:hypothetical protein
VERLTVFDQLSIVDHENTIKRPRLTDVMSDIEKRARLPSLSSVHQERATTISFEPEKWFVEDNKPRVLAKQGPGQPYPLRLAG